MQFDLISDLHIDLWRDNIKDWRGLGTSLVCVVAGDISRDTRLTASFVKHLCDSYKHVIFIDGNHEHKGSYDDLATAQLALEKTLDGFDNLTYLADATAVIDGTAFIGANGWWTFDFPELAGADGRALCMEHFCRKENLRMKDAVGIWTAAQEQSEFLANAVSMLNERDEVGEIVLITHTVPRHDLIFPSANDDIVDWSKMGNSSMQDVLHADIEGKISTWCFGHYHSQHVDVIKDGVRYISHPRGRPDDAVSTAYYPKRIDTALDVVNNG
jgi:UDP-2,3-diacylglucosamine pyrophosphatase LpxH